MSNRSHDLFKQACSVIVGGVNSPVRAFSGVGGVPLYFKRAQGAYLYDVDDRRYIDYVGSWGPMILGHAYPAVIQAVQEQAASGLSFGAPTEIETAIAQKVIELIPTIQLIRFVNSGTEATMSAIRLARGYTGRDKIIKFAGCYHGHSDSLLAKAGSGLLDLGIPDSPGVPSALAEHTLTLTYNHLESVEQAFRQYGEQLACVIVEPVAGNMGCVLPVPGFLPGLRRLCSQYGALLIFDEVMSGFRVALGGAQAYYKVKPDLTTLGKILGGGLPVGAFGGSQEVMQHIAPLGSVYQAGTLSGCPVAMAAGLQTLKGITQAGFYDVLSAKVERLAVGLSAAAKAANVPMVVNHIGGMFGLFFTQQDAVNSFADVSLCDQDQFRRFFHGMLDAGVYFAPSAFECGFMSASHNRQDIDDTINRAQAVLSSR